ncbi:hypothetical protein [Rhodopila sp.]|uniref:hypothetical protein n=1 Tax=Rhodopila sp. TaxID=2480087 RepID=UPI003D0BCEBD
MPDDEPEWRIQFERGGEQELRDAINRGMGIIPETKRQFAFRWLREKADAKEVRERRMLRYTQFTLWAAIAAVLVGVIGILVTLLH